MSKVKINESMFERLLTIMEFWESSEEMVIQLSDDNGNELVYFDQKMCVVINEETYWFALEQLIAVQRERIYNALVEQLSRSVDVIIYDAIRELSK